MPNRLAEESSPYLQQHADNPVDWYPWGEEALQRARAEDKPIFLSVGYSACHWCHVMARESFEDQETAEILNEHFVSIKVDREERPDLDRIYMSAVQALTGSGGWPMSVFLTPDGKPFYAGTYFPPEPRYGMPSFKHVLRTIADAWERQRQELVEGGDRVVESIGRQMAARAPEQDLESEALARAFRSLRRDFDDQYGGWDGSPKFPQPMIVEFLLRHHHVTGEPEALRMAVKTLDSMARGGIYDQLGGGFHRYSVDERWVVPHFEKMLYDNAQLSRVYLHGWQVTGEPLFRAVVEETLDYVGREMTDPAGGFCATQSAESEGEEGKFFIWSSEEIERALDEGADRFMSLYGVTPQGNFEGKNILTFSGMWEERQRTARARRQLFEVRQRRERPERDEKVLTAWNGLMLAAFAEAGQALQRRDYLEVADRNAAFLLDELRADEGHLLHTWRDGQAKGRAYLEDYTHFVDGLLALYQATFDPRWYQAAEELVGLMLERFRAAEGGFFDTGEAHEELVTRPRSVQDNAIPSGNSMAAWTLLRLTQLSLETRYADIAHRSLRQVQQLLAQYPLGFGQWLTALNYALADIREIAIVGHPEAPDVQAMLRVSRDGFQPHQVLAVGEPGDTPVPLLQDRDRIHGKATAYVCVDFTCRQPVTDPEALRAILEA
ncbi:MAG: thioredoxin domain-containing protein [Anaerolineae bacterium]